MTLLKRLQEEARKQARWLHALIELKDVENSLDGITANTVTVVLDEVEREVAAGDLTRKFMESLEHPTPEEYYAYNQGIADIKAIITNKRTEI